MNGVIATKGVASALYALRTTLEEPQDKNLPAALQHAQRPRSKPIRRVHIPLLVVASQASSDLSTNALALVCVGQLAALTNKNRKSALASGAGKDEDVDFTAGHDDHGRDHELAEGAEVAHDAPGRLDELRERLAQLPQDELARYTAFADTAAGQGYGFAIEAVAVDSLPNKLGETQLKLASHDVMPSLCAQGCIYAGPIVSTQVGNKKVDVIDATSAEAIKSFEGLSSYLKLFR